jgi:hypothetical protein
MAMAEMCGQWEADRYAEIRRGVEMTGLVAASRNKRKSS